MSIGVIRIPSLGQFRYDTRNLLISAAIVSIGNFGVQQLLKVLYVLRLGYGLEYVGMFTAMPAIMYMAMSLPSGWIGAKLGLKRTMVIGLSIATIGMFALPMTEFMSGSVRYVWPIVTQLFLTFGWAMYDINLVPSIMSATTDETRDDAFALLSMLRGAGTFFGTVAGGLLPAMMAIVLGMTTDSSVPYQWALIIGAVFGAIGLVPMLRVQIEDVEEVEESGKEHGPFPYILVLVVCLHVILMNAGYAINVSFGSAYMDTDLFMSTASIGFVTAIGQFIAIMAPIAMPYLGALRGHSWTMMLAGLMTSVMFVPLAFIMNWQAASIGRIGLFAMAALWIPALQVFQMTSVEKHWRSVAYGCITTAMGFSYGAISLVGGFVAASQGYGVLFSIGIVICFAGGGVMLAVRKIPKLRRLTEPVRTETPVIGSTT